MKISANGQTFRNISSEEYLASKNQKSDRKQTKDQE